MCATGRASCRSSSGPKKPISLQLAGMLGGEYVVQVTGKVTLRPEGTRNANIGTGDVEVDA